MSRVGVVIGRFQPIHRGHWEAVISPALAASDTVFIVIGSANAETSDLNPFSVLVRITMILDVMSEQSTKHGTNVYFYEADDFPGNNIRWAQNIVEFVEEHTRTEDEITLYASPERYVEYFPAWRKQISERGSISATSIRERALSGDESWREDVFPVTAEQVDIWRTGRLLHESSKNIIE